MTEEGKFVTPGESLGISEEFMPGYGTYEEDGSIFAAVSGTVKIDMRDRSLSVAPKVSVPPEIHDGDIIIGKIWEMKSQLALVDILKIKGVERGLPGNVRGALHISKARAGYVSDLSKEFTIGDVIAARVVDAGREPVELTTAGRDLGVVKAFCSRCGASLEPFKRGLRCVECRNVEPRNVSDIYGKGEV
ncbi:MAG: RNA-binding protein [Methanobacteriota archaeon]|nr:MAG: RNA-binding protein [Euryarchaeota archaeon]